VKGGTFLPVLLVGITPLLVFTIILLGIVAGPIRWEPPTFWSTEFGTSGPNIENRVSFVSADTGGVYAAGYVGLSSLIGVNATPSQLFVSRYDLSHQLLWSQPLGNPKGPTIMQIAGGTDGVYVVGYSNSNGFVQKYGLQGNLAWAINLTSPMSNFSNGYAVSVGTAGVYVVTANRFTNSSISVVLKEFDLGGRAVWTQPIDVSPDSLDAGANGLYVSGFALNGSSSFVRRYDFNGALVWNRQLSCTCWAFGVSTDASGVYVAGRLQNLLDAFVAKYDWDGNQLWIREFRPPDRGVKDISMSVNPSGIYLAMITTVGDYLEKYDGNGNSVWLLQIPSAPYSISVSSGSVYVGGEDYGNANAVLSEYAQSSSLIFFGLNPPFSFLAVSLLTAAATISILWLRKRAKTRAGNLPHRLSS
jgi:hypothetical protein